MKKKFSVFILLLSLMLAVLVPVQVKAANSTETTADDTKYRDIEDFMHGLGYSDFSKNDNGIYLVYFKDNHYYVVEFIDVLDCKPYFARYSETAKDLLFFFEKSFDGSNFKVYKYWNPEYAELNENYSCLLVSGNVGAFPGMGIIDLTYKEVSSDFIYAAYIIDNILYSDLNVYMPTIISGHFYPNYENVIFESSLIGPYTFEQWCSDAGLNCASSSNESTTVIPYSYNDYWHIVRKTSSGNWLLTTIGSTLGQSKMNLRLSDSGDLIIYEFSGDDSFVISVREYEYDTDGWKVRTYDTYDYDNFSSGLLTLPAGSGLDDTRVLAYTSTDIYASDGLSVYAATSTEYIEPSVPDVTPEPTPGSGSSGSGDSDDTGSSGSGSSGGGRPGSGTRPSLGGEASGGGGLDFIINLFTLIWTKICAVPMSVDGYSISLQQLFVYGALVSIVGGFIIKFIFRR